MYFYRWVSALHWSCWRKNCSCVQPQWLWRQCLHCQSPIPELVPTQQQLSLVFPCFKFKPKNWDWSHDMACKWHCFLVTIWLVQKIFFFLKREIHHFWFYIGRISMVLIYNSCTGYCRLDKSVLQLCLKFFDRVRTAVIIYSFMKNKEVTLSMALVQYMEAMAILAFQAP